MPIEIYGNTQGLKSLIKRRLTNLYGKRLEPSVIITADLARQIMDISKETSRQIGLIINRRGGIEYVIVGDNHRIEIPPLSTERTGRARFRGVRFVHTHLKGELLSREDLTDLALLQLDLVACITEMRGERGETIHVGYLVPENRGGRTWDFMEPVPVSEFHVDFTEFITELENEFVRERGRFYATKETGDRCIVVSVVLPGREKHVDDYTAEMKDLCYSAGITVIDTVVQRPKELHPRYLIGRGKIEEIVIKCQQLGADLLVFDEELTPGQIKNISGITELKVIDRNQLILDIFAGRANTTESRIQVELAQLRYIMPRLTEKSTAFSRLMGGIGGRGPGEQKLEVDRRRVRDRISFLERRLKQIRKVRDKKRQRRRASLIPIVSIVGYTNSGKSTLLNLLTKSKVEVEDKPFSTLNPTTRIMKYPERKKIILTDTVGFITHLPEVLLRAFMATLEELEDAHLLLHLVDISAPDFEDRIESVEGVINSLGLSHKKRLIVFNKIDKVDRTFIPNVERRYNAVSISASKKEGIDPLVAAVEEALEAGNNVISTAN
ncbi:MAG: GTPase HflX [Syntrophorhabdaceae bacterium]|nr:GTPase HflX [Syntrophorhabdaceae bacterium]MDD4196485.1 GTPase HflX [Syntrophorhabdaceae bacterium]